MSTFKIIRTNFKCIILVLFILYSHLFYSQDKTTSYSDQYWLQYYGQYEINSKWTFLGDGGIRMKNACKEKAATLGRIGIQYKINKSFSVAAGGAYFSQYINDKISREEWRGWQEIFYKHSFKRFYLSHRIRLEERWFHSLATQKDNFNFRSRYRFYFTVPINHSKMQANTVFFIGGDEFFVNFGDQITYNFDQNRAIAGIGYKLNESLMINLTYVYQYAQRNTAINFERTDLIWLGFVHSISRKEKADNTESIESPK